MELYAWVGEDESKDYGIKMILTPYGASAAVFATRRLAESLFVLEQIQAIATKVNRPMRLVRCTETESVRTLTPNPQG